MGGFLCFLFLFCSCGLVFGLFVLNKDDDCKVSAICSSASKPSKALCRI